MNVSSQLSWSWLGRLIMVAVIGGAVPLMGAAAGQAAPADCTSACLSVAGVANIPAADADDNIVYSYTITNSGPADTLTSFTVSGTRGGVVVFNGVPDASVNGVPVPGADVHFVPGSDPEASRLDVPTPIAADGGQVTISFNVGGFEGETPAATSTTLTIAAQSGQSVAATPIVTPYPAVDVATRDFSDDGYANPSIGNAKAIVMHVPAVNEGTGPAPRVSFTFTLGAGWAATDTPHAPGPNVSCTHTGTTWTCDELTPVDNFVSGQAITLIPPATAGINVVRTVHVHIDTIGETDQVPSNNNIALGVEDTGTADTGRTVSVASTHLTVGGKTTVTVVVENRGPQTTNGLRVLVLHDGNTITDHVVLSSGKGAGAFEGYDGTNAGYEWIPPAMAPGDKHTATFTLTGKATGTGWVSVTTHAVTYDPGTEGVSVRTPNITVA